MAILMAATTVLPANAWAADNNDDDNNKANDIEATIGVDLVSRYIWRGQDYGAVSLQPSLALSYNGLSLEAWGNVGLSEPQDDEEIDLTLRYEHKCGLHVAVTDYWMAYGKPSLATGEVSDPNNRYFAYASHNTNHVFEANIGYDFGVVSFDWFTNFAGDDSRTGNDHRQYSSYMEANIPFALATCQWTATVGAVPYKSDFYSEANGFAVVNVSLRAEKEIEVTPKFSIPLFAGIAANPSNRKAYMAFGFTLGI